jgi:hypothetical protein
MPSVGLLVALAHVLGASLDELVGRDLLPRETWDTRTASMFASLPGPAQSMMIDMMKGVLSRHERREDYESHVRKKRGSAKR